MEWDWDDDLDEWDLIDDYFILEEWEKNETRQSRQTYSSTPGCGCGGCLIPFLLAFIIFFFF